MAAQETSVHQLSQRLQLDQESSRQLCSTLQALPDGEAAQELESLLGDSPETSDFIASFLASRKSANVKPDIVSGTQESKQEIAGEPAHKFADEKSAMPSATTYAPPPGPPPTTQASTRAIQDNTDSNYPDEKHATSSATSHAPPSGPPPTAAAAAPPAGAPPRYQPAAKLKPHTNAVIRAGQIRAKDEQEMQNWLQTLQYNNRIFNSEIEPEHETEYYCTCAIHQYQRAKWARIPVQDMWAEAVMYPGEKAYNDSRVQGAPIFTRNPYMYRVTSPFGNFRSSWGPQSPIPDYHAMYIRQVITMNNALNTKAQRDIDSIEPRSDIWQDEDLDTALSRLTVNASADGKPASRDDKRASVSGSIKDQGHASRFAKFKKSIGIKSDEEKAVIRMTKQFNEHRHLRDQILQEENGRWQDDVTRQIVTDYQTKVGMAPKIAHLRMRQPIQYLHLLRAGYFEPIPVAWAGSNSNPLKFSIESTAGWRGITPAWRGYEDTAEERLYWVLNHREGTVGTRMKPDFISAMELARARMASAQPPPPEYFSDTDTCHLQKTSSGYSNQVMPSPFVAFDRPEVPTDDTMILLDVSGSMDFDPVRPVYNKYLITGYTRTTQPKNKDVARAIIRRFTDAMANHDQQFRGYDLTTFSSEAHYIGCVNHRNLDELWRGVRIGGGTRVMTGWQRVKELHFQKHSASAIHHPVFGWQAGPETPMLRLLLLLDGEATDMDEFELDLLGLSWAHVTIFLIGADGCPHHHRHANELQRISDVNHHVSFVDAQGNCPERFVTHELLKRHLGYEISMTEFTQMEELPPYTEI